jgi:(2Fe-2S) ferredoxin
MAGSAPQARGWLLLEHPGPWPVDAVAGSGIEPVILQTLSTAAAAAGTRVLLVRRPGRPERDAARSWMLTGPGRTTVSGPWREDVDLQAAAVVLGTAPADGPVGATDALILVCAHGMHDACCAIRGRPVAAALAESFPRQVWECSHVGGDRFAPNVVVLPDGFYYGNLDPDSAVRVVRKHVSGAVEATALRGMAQVPPPVQAAAVAAYERLGPLAPGAVLAERVDQVGPHDGHGSETTVVLRVAGMGRVRVEVLAVRRPVAQLTCRAPRETPATEYQVVSFVPLPSG